MKKTFRNPSTMNIHTTCHILHATFFFILIASVHNFANDNTLSVFAENISKLINILQSESEVISDWFKKNQTMVNPDKFQVIIIDKKRRSHIRT